MGTPFVSILEPTRLDAYIRGVRHDQQPAVIPKVFCDAMEVREIVFVEGQGVPAQHEFDADDSRACHWVSYASVNQTIEHEVLDDAGNIIKPRSSSTRTTPCGTLRLVPFPHNLHPKDGGVYVDGVLQEGVTPDGKIQEGVTAGEETKSPKPAHTSFPPFVKDGIAGAAEHVGEETKLSAGRAMAPDRATEMHDGKEPYVKLGRLAVIEEFRGNKLARLLVTTALNWLKANPAYFNPNITELGLQQIGASTAEEVPMWKGLVCVHAQKQVVGLWEKLGFKVDEGLGTWWEEGMEHKGMFLRLEVDPTAPVL